MLGDDDALTPQFGKVVNLHTTSSGADVIYLAAYHYCYPNVIPGVPRGYFAEVHCEFLQGSEGEFCLTQSYARELAGSVLEFRHRFNYNAQHFLLKKSFVDEFDAIGGLYQSPYPDFFAAVATFYEAACVLVLPKPAVVIGISPKSFGAYYFSLRSSEGYKFLDNQGLDQDMQDFVRQAAWPGDMNNTNWLISAEMAKRALGRTNLPQLAIDRYRAIQIVSLLRDKYWHGAQADSELTDIAARLSTIERTLFDFLRAALELTARRDKNLLVPMLQGVEKQLGQYAGDFYKPVDIGAHASISDALDWLSGKAPQLPNQSGKSEPSALRHVLRSGAKVVRHAFPAQSERIIASLKRGPLHAGRALVRASARSTIGALIGRRKEDEPRGLRIEIRRGSERCLLTPGLFDDFEFRHGDELSVVPASEAGKQLKTPEGDVHLLTPEGKGIRVPSRMTFTRFRGYQMPDHLVRLTGAGPETFDVLGKAHIANYRKYVGLQPGMSFLEIGSGMGRDAFQLIEALGPQGRYIGIDVQRESIVWCQRNITRDHPNFQFHHFDAHHELHNPLAKRRTSDFPLPAADRSIDRVSLQSVLTHIFEDEVVHYLKEIGRVLKADGLAYVTFLLYSEEIVAASRKNNLTAYGLRFEHRYGDGCYVDNIQYPTGGVAYTDGAMQRMIRRAGLRLARPYLKGQWSGFHAQPDDDGQDVAILRPGYTDQ